MQLRIKDARRAKQLKILGTLAIGLCLIVFEPTLRLALGELFRHDPVHLANVNISIPHGWMISERYSRLDAWRPCSTILCDSPPTSFTIETTAVPDQVWENAARATISKTFPAKPNLRSISTGPESVKCLELDPATADGKALTACFNSTLGLSSTFFGDSSVKPVFYAIFASARKVAADRK